VAAPDAARVKLPEPQYEPLFGVTDTIGFALTVMVNTFEYAKAVPEGQVTRKR
jgi:hypothetical protein